ncbi:MAG: hypothetical protein IJW40_11920 [Clostridia bacterium]|nr:hypothetical protein [Clostridia bacterium]MBQ7339141.1 hypothetical protein [Clostridia bacterium]
MNNEVKKPTEQPQGYGPSKPEIIDMAKKSKIFDLLPKSNSAIHSLLSKLYTEEYPKFRFIGKAYGDEDRVNGSFGDKWSVFFDEDHASTISKNIVSEITWEDSDSYIGLMRCRDSDPFIYAVGMFVPADTIVPEGFIYYDFPVSTLGICHLHGFDAELYGHEADVAQQLELAGYRIQDDNEGAFWFFERYVLSRYATPDEEGHQTLDIGFFVEPKDSADSDNH